MLCRCYRVWNWKGGWADRGVAYKSPWSFDLLLMRLLCVFRVESLVFSNAPTPSAPPFPWGFSAGKAKCTYTDEKQPSVETEGALHARGHIWAALWRLAHFVLIVPNWCKGPIPLRGSSLLADLFMFITLLTECSLSFPVDIMISLHCHSDCIFAVREMHGMQPVELFLGETQTSSVSFKAGLMLHVCDQAIITKWLVLLMHHQPAAVD